MAIGNQAGKRFQAMLFNRRLARKHDCGRAIIDARSIAGRHRTPLDEDGLELREILGGGVSPNELAGFEGSKFAIHCTFNSHERTGKDNVRESESQEWKS